MNIKPLADRVVVEPAEAETKTTGGIFIPENAKEKPQRGTIVAVGPGKAADNGELVKMEVSKGDTVLYGKYSGTEITIEGKDYMILPESDILAII